MSSSFCIFGMTLCGISVINQNVFDVPNSANSPVLGAATNVFGSFVNYASLGTVNVNKSPTTPHQSPCPKKFQYVSNGRKWRGVIRLKNPDITKDISLHAHFVLPRGVQFEQKGKIELANDENEIAEDLRNGLPIIYRVKFPTQNPVPKLRAIYINDHIYCGNAEETGSGQRMTFALDHFLEAPLAVGDRFSIDSENIQNNQNHHHHGHGGNNQQGQNQQQQQQPNRQPSKPVKQPVQQPQYNINPVNPTNPLSINQFQSDNSVCGTPVAGTSQSLVIGGQSAGHGEWPWLIAFYRSNAGDLDFICGGSLISALYVLTAAHCIQDKGRPAPDLPRDALLFIGKHNLNEWNEEGYERRGAKAFKVHPDWKPDDERYDADIALIEMDKAVKYTKFIRPVCLWSGPAEISQIVGQVGIVAGWGKNEDGQLNVAFPKKVNVPIASDGQCLRTNEAFVHITSDRTFCAGGRAGEGPCQGDSGGGLVIKVNKKWYIQGSIFRGDTKANTIKKNTQIRATQTNEKHTKFTRQMVEH